MEKQDLQTDYRNGLMLREAIRAELEETCKNFHALLDSCSDADLQRKSTNPAWTIRDLLAHIIYWLGRTPEVVEYVRKGTGVRHFPLFLFDWLNIWLTRFAARRQTRQSLAEKYDAAYEATLKVLGSVQEHEWSKGATILGNEYSTIESIIRSHCQHFEEHAEQIRQSLGHADI